MTPLHPLRAPRAPHIYLSLPKHEKIIDVDCLSDIAGEEGLLMEIAVSDLYQASAGTSNIMFTLSQQLG